MNWRGPLIFSTLKMRGSHVPGLLRDIRAYESMSEEDLINIRTRRLKDLLLYANRECEHYGDILNNYGVVNADGEANLERFGDLPYLSKEIIQKSNNLLMARRLLAGRKPYCNHTGGSTGQPIEFWQDNYYNDMNSANKIHLMERIGKNLGEKELKIWGSERDLFEGTIGWKARLEYWLYNRRFENCFHLTEKRILGIIQRHNAFKPKLVWGYVNGLYVVAQYVVEHGLELNPPGAVLSAAGTLYPHMEELISKAFNAPVFNSYGSRELGAIAAECPEKHGLHINSHSHYVEVVNDKGERVLDEEGELIVTSLTNYAMPFIRYRTGDRGMLSREMCPCGSPQPLLKKVSGRIMEAFRNANGDWVPPEYFIHLIGVVLNTGFIKKFQVIQDSLVDLIVKLVVEPSFNENAYRPQLDEIISKIILVMGDECKVQFEYVDDIPPLPSGKYLYTISRIANSQDSRAPSQ